MIWNVNDPDCFDHMKRYVAWPAWRRWVWRNLGR